MIGSEKIRFNRSKNIESDFKLFCLIFIKSIITGIVIVRTIRAKYIWLAEKNKRLEADTDKIW